MTFWIFWAAKKAILCEKPFVTVHAFHLLLFRNGESLNGVMFSVIFGMQEAEAFTTKTRHMMTEAVVHAYSLKQRYEDMNG